MSSRIWTNLYVDMIDSVLRPFGRARSVINRILHLFTTLLSELVKVRVCVANFVSMTLFLHGDAAVWIATRVLNQVLIQNVLKIVRIKNAYLLVRSINRPGRYVRVVWYYVLLHVAASWIAAHKFLNQELFVYLARGQQFVKNLLKSLHVVISVIK